MLKPLNHIAQRTMLILLMISLSSGLPVALANQRSGLIIKKEMCANEPVEIVDLRVKDKQIKLSERFVSDQDWYKFLSLTLKNTSGKTIVYLEIELEIPKTGAMEAPVVVPFVFGELPSGAGGANNVSASKRMTPNQSGRLELTESMRDFLTNYLATNRVEEVEEGRLVVSMVVYDDGLAWKNGEIFERNPKNPQQWRRKKDPNTSSSSTAQPTRKLAEITLGNTCANFAKRISAVLPTAPRSNQFLFQKGWLFCWHQK